MSASARCLCGKVRYTVSTGDTDKIEIGACHCEMCRRWSGGPGFATHPGPAPEIEGEEHIKWYRSSDWAERGFCAECGSNLFYRLSGDEPQYALFSGAFEDQSKVVLSAEIFIDEKPDFYNFAGDIPSMTGAEVFAMFAPPEETPEEPSEEPSEGQQS